MKHPNQATLALHAGGDLGWIARWRTERHLARCGRCCEEVAGYGAVREMLTELAETPEVPWNRLAAEMRANIRLGLAAGACVGGEDQPLRERPLFAGARVLVAAASVVVLLCTGLLLQRPTPGTAKFNGVEIRAAEGGIQVMEGGEGMRLLHGVKEAQYVTSLPSAQGSMGNQYVDPQTGYVTVASVYAE